MHKTFPTGLMWFRRDLRVQDNAALHHALKACRQLHCVFVLDREILDPLPRADRRVEFIRDARVRGALAEAGIAFHTRKDHVVFKRQELLSQGGRPYAVFTPYKNAWLRKVDAFYLCPYPVERYADALAARPENLRQGRCRRWPT